MTSSITAEFARECFEYLPDTGILLWKERPINHFPSWRGWIIANAQCAGKEAGSWTKNGYREVWVKGRNYMVHRIIFLILHGRWPHYDIDHINGVRSDNRQVNLREVSRLENLRNAKISRKNTSGHTGVHLDNKSGKWCASIGDRYTTKHLGYFVTKEDAVAARKEAEVVLGYHKNHGRQA